MRRVWVIVLVVGLTLLLLIPALLPRRSVEEEGMATKAAVSVGEPILRPHGQVYVTVDGREVYRGEMHSFTSEGLRWLAILTAYSISGGFYDLRRTFYTYCTPLRGLLGYVVEDGLVRTVESTVGKGWGYNSTHSWFIITASFIAPEDLTLRWFAISFRNCYTTYWGQYLELTIFNETLPGTRVSSGDTVAVSLWLYWRDNGALMENWFKLLDAVLLHAPAHYVNVLTTQAEEQPFFAATRDFGSSSWIGTDLPSFTFKLDLAVALGTDCRANPSRSVRALYNEVARVSPSVHAGKGGLSISFVVPRDGICEIGLVRRFTAYSPQGVYLGRHDMLIMRWASSQPLPAGSTVTIYLLPGG